MSETTEKKPAGLSDIGHPIFRGLFLLIGLFFLSELIANFDSASIGTIVSNLVVSVCGFAVAIFATKLSERAKKKQLENPDPLADVLRNPLKQLASNVLAVFALAVVLVLDLVLADPVTVGLAVLGGGVSLFLAFYLAALLRDRVNRVLQGLIISPFVAGTAYAICQGGYLHARLTDKEASFSWIGFTYICAISVYFILFYRKFLPPGELDTIVENETGEEVETPAEETPDAQPGGKPVETGEETGAEPVETEEQTSEGESE